MTGQNCNTSIVRSENQTLVSKLPEFVHVVSEHNGSYTFSRSITDKEVIAFAKSLLERRMLSGAPLCSCGLAKDFCIGQFAGMEDENFIVIFLNNQNHVLGFEIPFYGTINNAAVYPRTIVKLALRYNAAALMIAHNHPGGSSLFSVADIEFTKKLQPLMELIDVQLLDHILVAGGKAISMKERNFI